MSFVDQLGPHLPYLRRYARALTGSQSSGDAYVRTCLQAIANEPDTLDQSLAPKIALYRLFHLIWSSQAAELDPGASEHTGEAMAAEKRVLRITPASRQALLLTAMEGMSVGDAALILGHPSKEVDQLIAKAQGEIERDLATDVLIIEDEPVIAVDIENLVRSIGHNVVGSARTRDEAVEAAAKARPGLVLADIQLADGSSGIDAVADILGDINVPVIFITAFPERLLTGERPEPTYLITKPFMPETVKAAIGQALFFHTPTLSE